MAKAGMLVIVCLGPNLAFSHMPSTSLPDKANYAACRTYLLLSVTITTGGRE